MSEIIKFRCPHCGMRSEITLDDLMATLFPPAREKLKQRRAKENQRHFDDVAESNSQRGDVARDGATNLMMCEEPSCIEFAGK